jgi:hypothetical protein
MRIVIFTVLLLVLLGCRTEAAESLQWNDYLTWDSVTNTVDREPITPPVTYTLGLFNLGAPVPMVIQTISTNECPAIGFLNAMSREVEYEMKVSATWSGVTSPWSVPLAVFRVKLALPPPGQLKKK